MENYQTSFTIKQWAEDDRPREKMLTKGRSALSDAELIALLLGTGSRTENAVDLSKRILNHVQGNLVELSKLTVSDLCRNFKGIGTAKGVTVMAALELGRRRREAEVIIRQKISCSRDVFEVFQCVMSENPYEEFWILLLNRANRILRKISISEGGISGTVADPKKIFSTALEHKASSIILCHNHPSGNLQPSDADLHLTRKLKEAGQLLDLPVIDHIIIGEEKYYSFADEGTL